MDMIHGVKTYLDIQDDSIILTTIDYKISDILHNNVCTTSSTAGIWWSKYQLIEHDSLQSDEDEYQ